MKNTTRSIGLAARALVWSCWASGCSTCEIAAIQLSTRRLMTIQLFVADGAWDIAQVVSATRAGSNVVYEALIPWVFLAGFGMLGYEAFKGYQGSTASITGAILRSGVAVGLLTKFHPLTG